MKKTTLIPVLALLALPLFSCGENPASSALSSSAATNSEVSLVSSETSNGSSTENSEQTTSDLNSSIMNPVSSSEASNGSSSTSSKDLPNSSTSSSQAEISEEERKKELGITPVIDEETKTLTYGLYPQTHVNDENLISSLNSLTSVESNGWYLFNGAYYANATARPRTGEERYADGTLIIRENEYWFKCEPIKWKILTSSSGTYSLASRELLNAYRYVDTINDRIINGETILPCNYKHSDIRSWLNVDFYNGAFALDNSLIQTINVDNSHNTTYPTVPEENSCENTDDKVYLLSYLDYMNTDYFGNSEDRQLKPTDYALANGAFLNGAVDPTDPYYGNGIYWTRSPAFYKWEALRISYTGDVTDVGGGLYYTERSDSCVRPGLTIKIAE